MPRFPALLLLGPTGAGKSPLGDHLQSRGLHGRRCVHLDFGASLREVADGMLRPPALSDDEVRTVGRALDADRLLTDDEFGIAGKLLDDFLAWQGVGADDLVVLNGLPRHVGQARDLEPLLEVRTVLHLKTAPEIAIERIRTNAGGDRSARADDAPSRVRSRLIRYARRTLPLVEYYASRGARIVEAEIGSGTSRDSGVEALRLRLERAG